MKKAIEWTVFIVVILGAWLLAGPSTLGGPASYIIVDGRSMEPTYEHGDLVVALQRDDYELGEVIVYDAPVDAQFNVIHRIVDTTEGGFITQGDNRDEVDGWIAPGEEIHGAALFHVPHGGTAVLFLRQPATILALLAAWGTFAFLRRREDQPEPDRQDDVSTNGPDDEATPGIEVRSTRTATRMAARQQRAESRKQTLLLLGIAAAIGGAAGIIVANAATLRVDAGTLQAFTQQADIDVPPPSETEPHKISLQAHFFSQGSDGSEIGEGRSPAVFDPIEVPAGMSYQVRWNGSGASTVVDCEDDGISFRDDTPEFAYQGDQWVEPTTDGTHLLCVQTAPGNVIENIDVAVTDGETVEVELTVTEHHGEDDSDPETSTSSSEKAATPDEAEEPRTRAEDEPRTDGEDEPTSEEYAEEDLVSEAIDEEAVPEAEEPSESDHETDAGPDPSPEADDRDEDA